MKTEQVSRGFVETEDPFRLNWNEGHTVIDLLPFGEIEEGYTVNFDQRNVELSVLGYTELNDEIESLSVDNNLSIPVPPIHGIFLLKLLSWDDTKPNREKDLTDLQQILSNYWAFSEDEAYEKHLDLFDDDNFTTEMASARILGRHLKQTIQKSDILNEKIVQILQEQISQTDPPGPMVQKFANTEQKTIEEIILLLETILKGVAD